VECHKRCAGFLQNRPYVQAEIGGCVGEDVAEMEGDAAGEMDGQAGNVFLL
jgi:hypothetical protein